LSSSCSGSRISRLLWPDQPTLLFQDLGQSNDEWQVWIAKATRWDKQTGYDWPIYGDPDAVSCVYLTTWGPKGPMGGAWHFVPRAEGSDFVIVVLRIQNLQPEPRNFDLTAVRLAGNDHEVTPVLLAKHWTDPPWWEAAFGGWKSAEPRPELGAGEEIVRRLIFIFPEELTPERLVAAGLTIAFPAPDPG
jgi:hypothetical protein